MPDTPPTSAAKEEPSCSVPGCGQPYSHPVHNWPTSAASLARESPFTAEEWQWALNTLGARAETLLPTVKRLVAQRALTPHAASCELLAAIREADRA